MSKPSLDNFVDGLVAVAGHVDALRWEDARHAQHQLMRAAEAKQMAAIMAPDLDVEVRDLRAAVRALTDRVAQLEARLSPDAGLENPRRSRAR